MKHLVLLSVVLLAVASPARGHVLDEYLQALKVDVTPDRVSFFLDLTPGVHVAAEIVRRIDTNGDGVFLPEEAEAYGRSILGDLATTLSGAPLKLTLRRVELPDADALRSGNGVIRVEAAARGTPGAGPHELVVRNAHLPSVSVYLANALMPETPAVVIHRQVRDSTQQVFRLHYEIQDAKPLASSLVWLFAASMGLGLLVWLRVGGAATAGPTLARML